MKARKYRNRPGQSGNTESRNLVRAILSLTIAHDSSRSNELRFLLRETKTFNSALT